MKLKIFTGIVCFSVCALGAFGQNSQQPTQQQPPQQQQQQQPPPTSVPGTPTQPKPTVELPPTVPKQTPTPAQERDTGGDVFSIELAYWMTNAPPSMFGGYGDTTDIDGNLRFNGQKKYSLEADTTIPTGHENSLEVTYFRNQGTGNQIIPIEEDFFGNNFASGDQVFTAYTIQSAKLTWNYLTYPYPSNGAKFRVKTLWEVQFANISGSFTAPADVNASNTYGSKNVILPSFGIGLEYHPAKHVRLEWKGTGFAIPHHDVVADTEASAVLRFGRIETFLTAKYYHFKTSPKQDQYFTATLFGPLIGIRYMFK